jgi:hypothetical protein
MGFFGECRLLMVYYPLLDKNKYRSVLVKLVAVVFLAPAQDSVRARPFRSDCHVSFLQ